MAGFSRIFQKWQLADSDKRPASSSFSSFYEKFTSSFKSSSSVPLVSAVAGSGTIGKSAKVKKVTTLTVPKTMTNVLEDSDKLKLSEYLENSIRDSTKRTYSPYWRKFQKFCKGKNFNLNSSEAISLFMISLAEKSQSKSSAISARSAIRYFIKNDNPSKKSSTDSFLVQKIAKSIIKKYGRPVKKASPLGSSEIKSLVTHLLGTGSFKDERTAAFFLLQFTLFARFEEIAALKVENVKFLESGDLQIFIPKAKNYELWDSRTSLVAKGGDFDPVEIISSYISKLDSDLLFPNFSIGKKGKIEFQDSPVSYNNMLCLLRSGLNDIGLNGQDFSLHSLRTGSLSEAANSNVDKSLLQRHGRWKSSNMVNYYHKLSLSNKLSASRALAIYN